MSTRGSRWLLLACLLALALPLLGGISVAPADRIWEPVGRPRKVVVNSIGMKFVRIPAGWFTMGSPESEARSYTNEGPQHPVCITKPFYLGECEVTQAQYRAVMATNPSWFSKTGRFSAEVEGLDTDDFPVEYVSWLEAKEFCERLAALPGEEGKFTYRLPTEAEWEYACRAGTQTPFSFGEVLTSSWANFYGEYPYGWAEKGLWMKHPTRVGSYRPNAFGLHDMHGNVSELCSDRYGTTYYADSPTFDPTGPKDVRDSRGYSDLRGGPPPRRPVSVYDPYCEVRVRRGGSWFSKGELCRSARRGWMGPEEAYAFVGFRVVCVPVEKR